MGSLVISSSNGAFTGAKVPHAAAAHWCFGAWMAGDLPSIARNASDDG
jgi:hypothetical protein